MERYSDHGINGHKQNDRKEILQVYGMVAEKPKYKCIKIKHKHQQFPAIVTIRLDQDTLALPYIQKMQLKRLLRMDTETGYSSSGRRIFTSLTSSPRLYTGTAP